MIIHGNDILDDEQIWNACINSIPTLILEREEIFKSKEKLRTI